MSVIYNEPFNAFRFMVEVEGAGPTVVAAFAQFSGIRMQTHVVETRWGSEERGVTEKIPSITSFENVTLTKGVIGDNEFFDWILACAPSESAPPTGASLRRTINVVAVDGKGKRGVVWSLINAMPVSYTLAPMDSSQSAVLTETIEFSITGFKRVANPPA